MPSVLRSSALAAPSPSRPIRAGPRLAAPSGALPHLPSKESSRENRSPPCCCLQPLPDSTLPGTAVPNRSQPNPTSLDLAA